MKKTLSFLIAVIMLSAAIAAAVPASAANAFSDVDGDRWSAASIKHAVDNGYMNGVGGDRFDPEGPLTRAMVATVLWRREGSSVPSAPGGYVINNKARSRQDFGLCFAYISVFFSSSMKIVTAFAESSRGSRGALSDGAEISSSGIWMKTPGVPRDRR